MSPNKFIMKMCSNLMKLILYHEFYYFFYITLIKVQTILVIKKRELHSFMNGGSILYKFD